MGICRRATPQDIEHLEACRRAAISACPGYGAEQLQLWLAAEPSWPNLIEDTLLVEVGSRIAGFCVAIPSELRYLYVHPAHQRQGIGRFLVRQVEREGMRCDCNPFSARVLEKRGWIAVAPNRKEHDGVVFENTWYQMPAVTRGSR